MRHARNVGRVLNSRERKLLTLLAIIFDIFPYDKAIATTRVVFIFLGACLDPRPMGPRPQARPGPGHILEIWESGN